MAISKNQHVLHLMSSYGGGISSFIKNKAEVLKENAITFDIITFDDVSDSFTRSISHTNGHIHKIVNPKNKGFKEFYRQVDSIMSKLPKDTLVHSHINGIKALPFYFIAKKNGLKGFVIHAHTAAPLKNSNAVQEHLKQLINRGMSKEKLSCGVKASKNIFGEQALKENRIVHIPNSINPGPFFEDVDIKQLKNAILGVDDNRLIVGSIARFREVKNHKFMIRIIEELKNKGAHFTWFFAGDGLLLQEIKELVSEKELNDYVVFLGRREDISDLFKIMDIFVLSSLNEGLPTVVIEAQASLKQSLLSDTITRECDLGLGLVDYLPLGQEDVWAENIMKFRKSPVNSVDVKKKLIELKFTNRTSAELYLKFLEKKIDHYNIV